MGSIHLRHVHGSDKCVLRGRCMQANEFVMDWIVCVTFLVSGATCHSLLEVYRYDMAGAEFSLRNGRGRIL